MISRVKDDMAERATNSLIRDAATTCPIQVAYALLGQDCFRYLPVSTIAGGAAIIQHDGKWFIFIARTLKGARLVHAVGHELGHYYCARNGLRLARDDEEQFADSIASAFVMRWKAAA